MNDDPKDGQAVTAEAGDDGQAVTAEAGDDALDRLSIAPLDPGDPEEQDHIHHPRQVAGQDRSIAARLERNPESQEARLDAALDESMDASDPPASTQPVHRHEPPASSGYDPAAEAKLAKGDPG